LQLEEQTDGQGRYQRTPQEKREQKVTMKKNKQIMGEPSKYISEHEKKGKAKIEK